jgi:biotin carboxyl carrier protein
MSDERLRVTIADLPLAIQPAAEEAASFAPPQPAEQLRVLPATAVDRATGRRRLEAVVGGWRFEVTVEPARQAKLREAAARSAAAHHGATHITLRAQIPGRVVRLWVAEGEQVEANQRLLAIEAMKMENEIHAPHAGTVTSVRVEPGTLVERNDELLTIG